MRILLPTLHVRRSAQAIPLAAGNLKANLPKKVQHQTNLLDLYPEQTDAEMIAAIQAEQPELIAFPLYLWNRTQILRICRTLRAQHPNLLLIAGGPEASADATAVIEEGRLDGVICGEGEVAFAQLVERLTNQQSINGIPGFFSATVAGEQPQAPAVCPNLDQLPSPWLNGTLPLQPGGGVLWEVARGCSFNCAFCFDAKGLQGVRPLPNKRIAAELRLFADSNIGQIWILDSTFNAPPGRGKKLLHLLIEQAPQIHFHLEAKADFLDEEIAALLGELSCSVQIGLQSAQPEVLKPLHRELNPGKMTRALQLLSEQGVTFGLDLIYGLPGDTHSGFRNSINFALQQQPNQIDIFPLAVLPGTELHQKQAKFGISAQQHPPYLIQQNDSYLPEELEQSAQLAVATDIFYNRGRAVGFFLQFCAALSLQPVEFLERFQHWLQANEELPPERKTSAESWLPAEILQLQKRFCADQFRATNQSRLFPLTEDLLNYHFCCAELLLAEECTPPDKRPSDKQLLKQHWKLNSAVTIQRFNYDLEELEEFGWEKLGKLTKRLKMETSYGIFLQQQGQPIVEAVQNEFAQLLIKADGQISTRELTRDLPKQEALELLQFAVDHGLLLPVNSL